MGRLTGPRWVVPALTGLALVLAGGCAAEPVAAPPAGTTAPVSPSASTPPPSSATAPAPMARSRPVRVQIPAIGVDSRTMRLGLQDDGTMQVPPGPFPAGWYSGSPTPGELGPAVIVGHVHWNARAGVFADLARLTVGDEVIVRRADGGTAVFRVTRTKRFDKDSFPTARIYGDIDHAGLRLITCGGRNRLTGSYEDNLVVFARLA
jgi:LPXTG-site transpeptidase (sortase) family protein